VLFLKNRETKLVFSRTANSIKNIWNTMLRRAASKNAKKRKRAVVSTDATDGSSSDSDDSSTSPRRYNTRNTRTKYNENEESGHDDDWRPVKRPRLSRSRDSTPALADDMKLESSLSLSSSGAWDALVQVACAMPPLSKAAFSIPRSPSSDSLTYDLTESMDDPDTYNWTFSDKPEQVQGTSFPAPMAVPTSSFSDFCQTHVKVAQPTTVVPFAAHTPVVMAT
jgi:hypothetical protein